MWCQLLHLLALVPYVLSVSTATYLGLQYRPNGKMLASASALQCNFPPRFSILAFMGEYTGPPVTVPDLDPPVHLAFSFLYGDETTHMNTFCQYNATSVSHTKPGMTPRFDCEDPNVKFIWNEDKMDLTIIERLCHRPNAMMNAEVSGSIRISLTCDETGLCSSDPSNITGTFYSINPISG